MFDQQQRVQHDVDGDGLQALYVFLGLSLARDEIFWLLAHYDNIPTKAKQNKKISQDDFVDRQLPELLFHVEELRSKYSCTGHKNEKMNRLLTK